MQAKFIANNAIAIILLTLGAIFGAVAMYGLMILSLVATLIVLAITVWALRGFRGNIIFWIIIILIGVGVILSSLDFAQIEFAMKASFYVYCIFLLGYSFHLFKQMDAFYDKARMFGMITAGVYGTAAIIAFIVGLSLGVNEGYYTILALTIAANALRVVFIVFGYSQV